MTKRERLFFGFSVLCACGFILTLALSIYLANELIADHPNSPREKLTQAIREAAKSAPRATNQIQEQSSGVRREKASKPVATPIPIFGEVTELAAAFCKVRITNNSSRAIASVDFEVRMMCLDRTVPIAVVARHNDIPGGLEPQESIDWQIVFENRIFDAMISGPPATSANVVVKAAYDGNGNAIGESH